MLDAALLTLGLVLLVGAGDALVRGAVALSLRMGIPALIVSATVVAFGTSAPELLIAIQAAWEGAPGIALGNVVGSNTANVLLVLGLPALIAPIRPAGTDARRNAIVMLGATGLFAALLLPGMLYWWGGAALVCVALFLIWDSLRLTLAARENGPEDPDQQGDMPGSDAGMPGWKIALLVLAGLAGLPLGASLLIGGAQGIARGAGVSEAVIGLTVVAVGTSLPELATTVMAALRRQADVALGNVIGSNIFNITAVIGAAALTAPLAVPAEILHRDLWVMLAASLVLTPFVLANIRLGRRVGIAFLSSYIAYIYFAVAG